MSDTPINMQDQNPSEVEEATAGFDDKAAATATVTPEAKPGATVPKPVEKPASGEAAPAGEKKGVDGKPIAPVVEPKPGDTKPDGEPGPALKEALAAADESDKQAAEAQKAAQERAIAAELKAKQEAAAAAAKGPTQEGFKAFVERMKDKLVGKVVDPENPEAPPNDMTFGQFAELYPNLVEGQYLAQVEMMNDIRQREVEPLRQQFIELQMEVRRDRLVDIMESARYGHENIIATVSSEAFDKWFAAVGPKVQALFNSDVPENVHRVMNAFYESIGKPLASAEAVKKAEKVKADQAAERERQAKLHGGTTGGGRASARAGLGEEPVDAEDEARRGFEEGK